MPKMKVMIEEGPKGKRCVAIAADWPGLERAAKDEQSALQKLEGYLPRYASVAARAGMEQEFLSQEPWDVVERHPGSGSTDYWGISFRPASFEKELPSAEEWERKLKLLQAAWAEFDHVASTVSAELRRGPRGGGRMRDHIIRHTYASEISQMSSKVGMSTTLESLYLPGGLKAYRDEYIQRLRDYHQKGIVKVGRTTWTLPLLLRFTAYHILDHTWEMQDKDLTNSNPPESA